MQSQLTGFIYAIRRHVMQDARTENSLAVHELAGASVGFVAGRPSRIHAALVLMALSQRRQALWMAVVAIEARSGL